MHATSKPRLYGTVCLAFVVSLSVFGVAGGSLAQQSPFAGVATEQHNYPSGARLRANYEEIGGAARVPVPRAGMTAAIASFRAAAEIQSRMPEGFTLGEGTTTTFEVAPEAGPSRSPTKYVSVYPIQYQGIPLMKGSDYLAIVAEDGSLLHTRERGLLLPSDIDATEPTVTAEAAVEAATRAAGAQFAGGDPSASEPELEYYVEGRDGRLAWTFTLQSDSLIESEARRYWVAAVDEPEVLHWESEIYHTQQGTVSGNFWSASPFGGAVNQGLRHLEVRRTGAGGGMSITANDGRYGFTTGGGVATISANLAGPNVNVDNQAGPDLQVSASGTHQSPVNLYFGASNEFTLAQVSAFQWTNIAHDLAKDILDPTDLPNLTTRVNINSTCNAFWNGNSINFSRAGGSCPNTAYADVVLHEYGHGVDARKGGILDGGYSEGFGDAMAIIATRQPCLGRDFLGAGTCLRPATDVILWPPAPGEGVHAIGRRYAGFSWELIEQLKNFYSDDGAFDIAARLILGAALANPSDIPDAVHLSFLIDDDDGNLLNGTPHFNELARAADSRNIPRPPDPTVGFDGGPFWTTWFERMGEPVAPTQIKPNQVFTLTLDLTAFDLTGASPVVIGGPAGDPVRDLVRQASASGDTKVRIWVRPVLLGVSAPSGLPEGQLIIDMTKLRQLSEELVRDYEQFQGGALGLVEFADRARAAADDDGQPYRLRLRTGRAGCAAIAFSLWDESGLKPIDQIIVRFRIGLGSYCPIDRGADVFAAGLESLLATMVGETSGGTIHAALHVFEFFMDDLTAVALYVERRPEGFLMHSWQLSQPLTPYLRDHFPGILKAAQDEVSKGEENAYAPVARALRERIFGGYYLGGGGVEVHVAEAEAAFESLRKLAEQKDPARVLARLVNSEGKQIYLPLRLLAAGGKEAELPRAIEVIQPLPRESYTSAWTCVEPWRFVLPEKIEGVKGDFLAEATRGPTEDWLEPPVLDYKGLQTYFAPRPTPPQAEGLLLLAHQARGAIYFEESAPKFQYGDMNRSFANGSVAVLAACSVAGIDAENRHVLDQLNERGIETIIAAPFQVNAAFGSRLAAKLADFVHEVRSGARDTTRLVTLFDEAATAVAKDVLDEQGKNVGDMVYEFHVFGDHGARLCPYATEGEE